MRNTYYIYLLLGSTILSGTMLNLSVAQAACTPAPDCKTLGYTETSCTNGGVKCPWDTSKLFCVCDNSCSVGNILYSDMTCSSCNISGKTPIGVVSYVNGSKRIAIQLDNPGRMYWSLSSGTCAYQDIIGIPNYEGSIAASNDFSGKSNTAAYISVYGSSCSSYAPGYCNAYSTTGTSAGDWYLPALGELDASVLTNKTAVNAGLNKAGGTAIAGDKHWSSSEYASYGAYNVSVYNGNTYGELKSDHKYYVRCVLEFEDNGDGTARVCGKDYLYTCTGSNEAGGSGTACNGKYTACTCASVYEWGSGSCNKPCAVGDILFSDKTCNTALVSGKTAIGVVSYINGSKRIAIQLDNPGRMYWSSDYIDISGIPNYTDKTSALNDFSGKSNTQAWVDYWGASATSYAPGYCNAYSKGGVSGWYLPAQGELYASVWTNRWAVNAGLSAAGGASIQTDYYYHWSSSDSNYQDAWIVRTSDGDAGYRGHKVTHNGYVRCVLAF